jgi:hypothetical protein
MTHLRQTLVLIGHGMVGHHFVRGPEPVLVASAQVALFRLDDAENLAIGNLDPYYTDAPDG